MPICCLVNFTDKPPSLPRGLAESESSRCDLLNGEMFIKIVGCEDVYQFKETGFQIKN